MTWRILHSGPGEPAFNMALDEALLEAVARLNFPVLRFYSWAEPAATFGYFQHHAEIAAWTPLRPLIRRPTGGGLVQHDADWTYSVAIPPSNPWYDLRATESYLRLHEWIVRALRAASIPAEIAAERRKELPGQCFVGAEQFDVLLQGRKIAGAAQRRNREGLLIQGSLQNLPSNADLHLWQTRMIEDLPAHERYAVPEDLVARAKHLAGTKFSQAAYNQRR